MPHTTTFRNTCSIACGWMSLPGEPNGMKSLPFLNASAGFGVSRGRLPGATDAGSCGSDHDCEPRDDGHRPVPGMTGVALSRRSASPRTHCRGCRCTRHRTCRRAAQARLRPRAARVDARSVARTSPAGGIPPRAVADHLAPAPRGVAIREQRVDRHVDELRIAVIAMAIGERELERFGRRCGCTRRSCAPSPSGRSRRAMLSACGSTGPCDHGPHAWTSTP